MTLDHDKMPCSQFSISNRPVAIIGAGALGRRIACVFVSAGYNVHIADPAEQARKDAAQFIDAHKEQFFNLLQKGDKELKVRPANFGSCTTFPDIDSAVWNTWLVIEAVPENLQLKIDTMGELDKKVPTDCLIASNSSLFKSRLMLDKVRPEKRKHIFNMHFCMPPAIPTVELMTCGETEDTIFPAIEAVLRDVGLKPFTVKKESTGFIFNRLWTAIKREVLSILAEGISDPLQIDEFWEMMFYNGNLPLCKLMDQIGLDTVDFIEDNHVRERHLDARMMVDWQRKHYVSQGRLGLKSDKGGLYDPASSTNSENALDPSLYLLDVGFGQNLKDISKIAENGRVLRRDPDGRVTTIVQGLGLPDGIDISRSTRRIFWTNMGKSLSTKDGSVMSANLDGTDLQVLVPEGMVHTPKQLVVDDIGRKVYFCDREGLTVNRCNFDGSNLTRLVRTGNIHSMDTQDRKLWCVGVAIDTKAGKIYWTQKGPSKQGEGRIFCCGIEIPMGETADTRSDIQLLLQGLPEPIDLELDLENGMLYWTDRGEHPRGSSLNRYSLGREGQKEPEILARHFSEPIGLKLDCQRGVVYVTDLGGSLYRVRLTDGEKEVLQHDDGSYTGITLE